MPEFVNPFSGTVPERKLTKSELIRAIRLNIAADATDHALAKQVLIDIANEEREHVGEFMELLEILAEDEAEWVVSGREEVREMAAEMGWPSAPAGEASDEAATIGSMK